MPNKYVLKEKRSCYTLWNKPRKFTKKVKLTNEELKFIKQAYKDFKEAQNILGGKIDE